MEHLRGEFVDTLIPGHRTKSNKIKHILLHTVATFLAMNHRQLLRHFSDEPPPGHTKSYVTMFNIQGETPQVESCIP